MKDKLAHRTYRKRALFQITKVKIIFISISQIHLQIFEMDIHHLYILVKQKFFYLHLFNFCGMVFREILLYIFIYYYLFIFFLCRFLHGSDFLLYKLIALNLQCKYYSEQLLQLLSSFFTILKLSTRLLHACHFFACP